MAQKSSDLSLPRIGNPLPSGAGPCLTEAFPIANETDLRAASTPLVGPKISIRLRPIFASGSPARSRKPTW